jgi:AraC family transcriptional regulator
MSIKLNEGEHFGENALNQENTIFKLSLHHYESNYEISKHYHENDYLSILTNGNYLEQNQREQNIIQTGNILFRPKDYNHSNTFAENGGSCFNIEFKKSWNQNLDFDFKLPSSFENYKTGRFASLYKLTLQFKLDKVDENRNELIYDWLFQINQEYTISNRQPWIEKVKRILENELTVFHSLSSISDTVFVHPIYLSGAFKKKTGLTISEYQLKMKLANAMHLLLNSKLSISEITFKNGFFDDAHFINSFKNCYGFSPLKFRVLLKS